ncbi:ATP-binding SpoIIE family protein phosphatase [Spirosoma flavum]|uniref:ATP-binding SpoIIE family protein phosphatase n=1 Tax=Spirosoma flavum TaxID=2048557 RepID=A0ABW6AC41_9BACT
MDSTPHRSFVASDRSYGASIKREVRLLATRLRFSEKKLSELDIIVAELLSNLVKYAIDGELLVKPIHDTDNASLELISVDSGPGMSEPNRMMVDGVSTGGSLGQGLGAIQRLADEFQLYSHPGRGTVMLVRLHQKIKPPITIPARADIRCICVPKTGETACGDAYFSKLTNSSLTVFLGDGLGHGVLAQDAVDQAIQALGRVIDRSPASLLAAVHEACTGTRGLVGTCAVFDFTSRKWKLCGVGNIVAKLSGSLGIKGYISQNGILGNVLPRTLLDVELPYERNQVLIMTSDGLQARWNPARYPSIGNYDPSVLAAIIYKECARHADDMSVLVSKLY